ncbi:cysteine-rich with EGF-like domain protein 2 isoform X1 [Dermacentor silvarum]|uniref:cysteine-rich with EGF-like domain protein 2 isoform X1 n=1 Tax=Dermacentor silvarum TaxID=543639 RepID=UPI0018983375|nr:cysteine-rich with EGF-like domain protein 2 isoform X1 [Dermacentor silvarum]
MAPASAFLRVSGLLLVGFTAVCRAEVQFATAIDISDLGERVVRKDLLPACQACKTVVKTFQNGIERTKRSRFDGGDVDWEARNMGKYSKSEIRFIEIQEHLCLEIVKGQEHCRNMAAQYEEHLEEWWFEHQDKEPDLHKYLCIDQAKACCPEGHYGPNCDPCTGGAENPCNGHGRCKGSGTRKGNGKCDCHKGYMGELCDSCTEGYYEDKPGANGTKICTPCDKSCKGPCTEGGPKACKECVAGYVMNEELGCVDIDECIESEEDLCAKERNTFCANTQGSYKCMMCDFACDGCTGDGPDHCVKCAKSYVLKDKTCIDNGEKWRELHILLARYATYLGLCIATLIIFKRSPSVASAIGLCVGVYIGFSEYTLSNWKDHSVTSTIKEPVSESEEPTLPEFTHGDEL